MKATKRNKEHWLTKVRTYNDIKINKLNSLGITDLRELADKTGIFMPMSKTQDELISEIQQIVERELNYYSFC